MHWFAVLVLINQMLKNPLIEKMFDGMVLCEIVVDSTNRPVDFIIHEINRVFCQMMGGMPREKILEKKFTSLFDIKERSLQKLIGPLGEVALTGEDIKFDYFMEELQRWFEISAYSPKKKHFIAIVKDITDRMELLEELEKKYEELRELDALKDEFYEDLAHELRTPLTAIKGFIELHQNSKNLSEEYSKDLDIIMKNELRLERLVTKIMDYSRLKYMKFNLKENNFHISGVIKEIIYELAYQINDKNLIINLNYDSDIEVSLNKDLISKIITNLLVNAIKFSFPGGKITIEFKVTETWNLSIQDQGIGIPINDLEKLFIRFSRLKNTKILNTRGIGIGLALCKRVVDLYQGKIWAESEGINKGSKFSLEIPLI